MSKIRTFVAIPVVGLTILESWMDELKQMKIPGKIKWNERHLWHLTLKFIGNIERQEVDILRQSLKGVFRDVQQGKLVVSGTGVFGTMQKPRVVWAGIDVDDWLLTLKQKTEQGVSVLDIPGDDRSFSPHLTIGRVKYLKQPEILKEEVEKKKNTEWGIISTTRIVLYESKLTSEGPVYSEIENFNLSKV
ncbi:RNA 2',3'-cyclic phosphodiesterase [Anaerophaga thermohalophila]|uniref:RNA 2',3'-cyclic phosphodiesterase n=1 Tax=Anaerophaga thermohalophila TaxID=177400 RepID=UPI000237C2DB|nr:RNA 2',3'-cyclic phosphodiesterase [Anaerophaga thermohalophila]